jgi:shikimate dehydrogenase
MTKIVGILGDPIGHSLSPVMHNAAFRALGIDWVYVPARVRPRDLSAALRGIRAMGWAGVNLTIPHKQRAMRLVDRASREARLTGATNTIVCAPRGLVGHNTDGRGYVAALREELDFDPRRKRVVMIGAGGAARGIAVALMSRGVSRLTILNRTSARATALARSLGRAFKGSRIAPGGLNREKISAAFAEADLLVNATAVGMGGTAHRGLPLKELPSRAIVSDIVYGPRRTPLLVAASRIGLRTQGGLGMLLHQGAEAFELWTGEQAPIDVMRRALRRTISRAGPG